MPTSVNIPFQALVDDGMLAEVRLTLVMLYAFADENGIVDETPMSLAVPRGLHKNSVRRHLYTLHELRYVLPLSSATKLDRIPLRSTADGWALTLRPDGQKWAAAHATARIGSKGWDSKKRWA